jgi:hypothetical protein
MGSRRQLQSHAKLTVARMEVRKVSRYLTLCVACKWYLCGMAVEYE